MSLATEGELDAGVFEELLQPLNVRLGSRVIIVRAPVQVSQLADRCWWDKRSADQAVRAELCQPGGIGDIAFAAGQVLHLPGVDQHHLEPGVLEQVVERLPVAVASITTKLTCSSTRCSRNARTAFVVEAHVRTVSTVLRRPRPAMRTQTFASALTHPSPHNDRG